MYQVKKNVENSVQTKQICILFQVCREVWKGCKMCRGRKKFENHWFKERERAIGCAFNCALRDKALFRKQILFGDKEEV